VWRGRWAANARARSSRDVSFFGELVRARVLENSRTRVWGSIVCCCGYFMVVRVVGVGRRVFLLCFVSTRSWGL